MSTSDELTSANLRDVTGLIALWLAIHGGDPGPEGSLEVVVSEATLALGQEFLASLAESSGTERLSDAELTGALSRAGITPRGLHKFCREGDTVMRVVGAAAIGEVEGEPGTYLISDSGAGADEVAYFCVNGRFLLPAPGELRGP